jgi:hypothetical protein
MSAALEGAAVFARAKEKPAPKRGGAGFSEVNNHERSVRLTQPSLSSWARTH